MMKADDHSSNVASSTVTDEDDGDIQTIRSSHFSFGSPSTLSTQPFRDQERFAISLGGMQEGPDDYQNGKNDIEVGLNARPSWERKNPARSRSQLKDDAQSVEVSNGGSSSSSIETNQSPSGASLIFGGMFRFQNDTNRDNIQHEDTTDGLSTASPPLPHTDVPILHSLLQSSTKSFEEDQQKDNTTTTRPLSTSPGKSHHSRNKLPVFASSQLLFRKRQETAGAQRGLLGASANAARYPRQRGRQVERDNVSSSSSEGKKVSYDLTELPIAPHHNAFQIDGLDTTTRDQILKECLPETAKSAGYSSINSVVDVSSKDETMVDSLQTELDANSKQASLDYYNVPRRQPSGSTIEEEPQPSSFITLSTKNTDSPSVAAEVGSKEDTVDSIEIIQSQNNKAVTIPRIMPSPTQSTGAPSTDSDDDDIYTSRLSSRSSNHSSSSNISDRNVNPAILKRSTSDKDQASFDFSVHGGFSVEPTISSLDIAIQRGRTMAHQAQASLTTIVDDSRREKLGADIPITINTKPPTSEKVEVTPAPKVDHRKRNRCICIWLILLCTLVMMGAIASALCGLGKCQDWFNRSAEATDNPQPEIAGGEEMVVSGGVPLGVTDLPTNAPVAPLTIRDPPLPNDTTLPVPPTGPPTSMPSTFPPFIFSTSSPTAIPTLRPTEDPTRMPASPWPTRSPQRFPVFAPPTNTPTVSPTRSPTQNPTASPSLRPVPSTTPMPTTQRLSSSRGVLIATREALLAAIDSYLDGNREIPINNWDVSQITDFSLAFSAGRNRKAANFNEDLTNWDTRSAVSMRRMFLDAAAFNGNVSNFDTSNVRDMQEMFGRAERFNGDLSRWDVSQVTNMAGMFRRAAVFNSNISGWNTASVVDMTNMFLNCAAFNQDLSSWNVRSVTSFAGMFRSALSFNSDLRWNTENASTMATMFMEASSFNGDVSSFSTSQVSSMDKMFYYAFSFEGKGIGGWDTSSCVVFDRMFSGTISFRGDGLSNWNVGSAQFMEKMFVGAEIFSQDLCQWRSMLSSSLEGEVTHMFLRTACPRTDDPLPINIDRSPFCFSCLDALPPESPLLEIPLSSGSTGTPFSSRSELRAAVDAYLVDRSSTLRYGFPIGNWDVSAIRDLSSLFSTARNPAMATFNADLSNWDTSSAVDTSSMFEGATSFTDEWNGLTNWNTGNVRDMSRMFAYSGFSGDVSRWDVSHVANFESMFQYTFNFQSDLSNWNVSSGTSFGWMFRGAVRFNSDLAGWLVGSASDFTQMFAGAKMFNANLCSWSRFSNNNTVDTRGMFAATSCPSTLDPTIMGSWCSECRRRG